MTQLTRDRLVRRPFVDKKHYPYGFSRSGDFSIRESQLLQQFGSLLDALAEGQIDATTDEDMRMLAVMHGQALPLSPLEKVWVKYQSRIHRPKAASIHGSKVAVENTAVDDCSNDALGIATEYD